MNPSGLMAESPASRPWLTLRLKQLISYRVLLVSFKNGRAWVTKLNALQLRNSPVFCTMYLEQQLLSYLL